MTRIRQSKRVLVAVVLSVLYAAATSTAGPRAYPLDVQAPSNSPVHIHLPVSTDTDMDAWELAVSIATNPAHGQVSWRYADTYPTNSCQVIYRADPGFTGQDDFWFTVADGVSTSTPARCRVRVGPNGAPRVNGFNLTVAVGRSSDFSLSVSDDDTSTQLLNCEVVSGPTNGVVAPRYPAEHPTNSYLVSYTSTNGVGGDSFTFRASDGDLTSGIATCIVAIVSNTAPRAQPVNATTPSGCPKDLTLSVSDDESPASSLTCTITNPPGHGTVTWRYPESYPANSRYVTYTPDPDFVGTDTFAYVCSDDEFTSGPGTCTVTVVSNTTPSGNNASVTVGGDIQSRIDLTRELSDTEVSYYYLGVLFDDPAHGSLEHEYPDYFPTYGGYLQYTPDPGYTGGDSFTYRVTDGALTSGIYTCTITVETNQPPTAASYSNEVTEGLSLSIYLPVSDSHTAASDLTCWIETPPVNGSACYAYPSSFPQNSCRMEYTPEPGFTGVDTFTYRVSDGVLEDGPAICTIVVKTNSPPVAADMDVAGVEETPLRIYLDASDADESTYYLDCSIVTNPVHGTVTYSYPYSLPDGSYRVVYTPDPGFTGVDTFWYTAADGLTSSTPGCVTVTVVSNTVPIAYDVRGTCDTGATVRINANWEDPDPGQYMTVGLSSLPEHGTASVYNTSIDYEPDQGFTGEETFYYTVSDGVSTSTPARVRIQVRDPASRVGTTVLILVNDLLLPNISNEVARLRADMQGEGYATKLEPWPASGTTPSNVWDYLHTEYVSPTQWVVGAVLIGALPKPQTYAEHYWSGLKNHYTDLVYWNMTWYQDEGPINTYDIWVSRISAEGQCLNYGSEVKLIKRNLQANHDTRTGKLRVPHMAFRYAGSDWDGRELDAATLEDVWPEHLYRESGAEYTDHPNINERGADALVNGGDVYDEISHGTSTSYMNTRFNINDLHRLGAQVRSCLITSCSSGRFGGIVNNHLYTRMDGCLFSVGATDTCLGNAFHITDRYGMDVAFRGILASGESWGNALAGSFPWPEDILTVVYGDLSIGAMAAPSNALPEITSLTVSATKPLTGQAVEFTIAVADPDAASTNNPEVDYEHEVLWWPEGYDYGRVDPSCVTNDTQPGWTTFQHEYSAAGSYVVRVAVRDEWGGMGWREITVTANDPPVALDDVATVEAGHAVIVSVLTNDYDPNGHSISINTVSQPGHGSAVRDGDTVVYTATNNAWSGTDMFTYTIVDGVSGSATATVTVDVVSDVTPPVIVSVVNPGPANPVTVRFSEAVAAGAGSGGAEDIAHYTVDQGVVVTAAVLQVDARSVLLYATGLQEYVEYVLTVNDVNDRAGTPNTIRADSRYRFGCLGVVAEDDFESGDVSGGVGWAGDWGLADGYSTISSSESPYEGVYHARMVRTGSAARSVDVSGLTTVFLDVQCRGHSFDNASETGTFDIYDGDTWHTVFTLPDGEDNNLYRPVTVDISSYAVDSQVSVRGMIHGSGTGDYFYFDNVRLLGAGVCAASDLDGDGMTDNWEIIHFGDTTTSDGTGDHDGDGATDRHEFLCGTDPDDDASCFALTDAAFSGPDEFLVRWWSEAGKRYRVRCGTNLVEGFPTVVEQGIEATPPLNTQTCNVDNAAMKFYLIELQ